MIYPKIIKRDVLGFFIVILFLFSPVPGAFADTPTIKKLIDEGVNLLVNKKTSEALKKFDKVLLLSPDHAEAYFRTGQAYVQMKDGNTGLEFIQKSLNEDSVNVRYSLYLSSLYERMGDEAKAQKEYQRIIATGTRDSRIKEVEKRLSLATGRALAKKGELNAALLIFNGLLLEYPDDPRVLFNIAKIFISLKRIKEAEQVFATLYFQNPKNSTVNMNLAKIYEQTKRLNKAQKHLKKIIDLEGGDKLANEAREQYYIIESRKRLANKNWTGALESLSLVVKLNPRRDEVFFNIAMANLQLGEKELAEEAFFKVLRLNPKAFTAQLNLGQLYFDTGRLEKAKAEFQHIIDNDKTMRWAKQARIRMNVIHVELADRALRNGNVAESLVEYEKAADYYSANTKASFTRGMIFIRQKKFSEAMIEFETVVKHTPKNLRARINLANIYERLNMQLKAAEQYESIIDIDEKSKEATFAKGKWRIAKAKGLWEEKRLVEAEKEFEELTKEQPRNFQAFVYLGVLQSSQGKLRDAAKSYHHVLDLRPTNYGVKIMLGKVYEQLGMDSLAANEYRGIIFAGGRIPQVPEAKQRLAAVESRLSGFSNTLNYKFVYDNNLNLDDENPSEEVRSDLALSFIYAMKTRDDLSFRVSWSPTYSAYHLGQRDYLRSVLRSNIQLGTPSSNWNASISRQDQNSLLNDTRLSEATSLSLGRGLKVQAKPLLNLRPINSEGNIATSLNFNNSLRYIQSLGSAPVESVTGNISLSMSQSLRWGLNVNLSYVLTIHRNLNKLVRTRSAKVPVTGENGLELVSTEKLTIYDPKDYEYNSHALNLNLSRAVGPGLVSGFSFSGNFSGYSNLDSGAVARGKMKKRANLLVSFSPSLTYYFFRNLNFVLRGTVQKNFSSLPIGLSTRRLNDSEIIASFQSTSLGKYNRYSVEGGFVMRF